MLGLSAFSCLLACFLRDEIFSAMKDAFEKCCFSPLYLEDVLFSRGMDSAHFHGIGEDTMVKRKINDSCFSSLLIFISPLSSSEMKSCPCMKCPCLSHLAGISFSHGMPEAEHIYVSYIDTTCCSPFLMPYA